MPMERMHSFLVHPAKHAEEQPEISGTQIPRRGPLYTMLTGVLDRAAQECNIEIVFRPRDNGQPQNDCRELVVASVREASIPNGHVLAGRLQSVSSTLNLIGHAFCSPRPSEVPRKDRFNHGTARSHF